MGKKKIKINKTTITASGTRAAMPRPDKRKTVTDTHSNSRRSTYTGLLIALAIIAVSGFIVFGGGIGGSSGFSPVNAEAGVVKIPIARIADRNAHYYTYTTTSGKPVNFFVLKSSDNVIRAAFDACDVCYREKKGYRQEGDQMVCNNCGQRFPSVKINEIKGGCNPAPLNRTVKGENLEIKASDIEQGAWYF